MIRDWRWGLRCWIVLSVFTSLASYWSQQNHYASQISVALQAQLPGRIHELFNDVYMESQPEALLIKQVNRDLTQRSQSDRPTQCTIRMLSMDNTVGENAPWPLNKLLTIRWQLSDQTFSSSFLVTCQPRWLSLVTMAAAVSLVMVLLLGAMPRPITAFRAGCMKTLLEHGESLPQSYRLTASADGWSEQQLRLLIPLLQQPALTADQAVTILKATDGFTDTEVQWFLLGLRQTANAEAALAIARNGEQLAFETARCVVRIHGMEVKLSKTPFLYYLWYAAMRKRDEDSGWYTNPSSVRPDTRGAETLIQLMDELGGHQKALNELQQNGLRAKILDQNRNKIKDELHAVLGEELAKNYLFDSARDPKSGRSRYRLALNKELIVLPAGASDN